MCVWVECVMVGCRCAPGGAPGWRFSNTGQRAPSPCPDTRAHCSREAAARAAERLRRRLRRQRADQRRRHRRPPPLEGRPGTRTRCSQVLSLAIKQRRPASREIALADFRSVYPHIANFKSRRSVTFYARKSTQWSLWCLLRYTHCQNQPVAAAACY